MSSDGVIEAIDAALDDWQVSNDAMRWTPETPTLTFDPARLTATFGNFYAAIQQTVLVIGETFSRALKRIDWAALRQARLLHKHSWRDHSRRPRIPMRVRYADRNPGPLLAMRGYGYARRRRRRG